MIISNIYFFISLAVKQVENGILNFVSLQLGPENSALSQKSVAKFHENFCSFGFVKFHVQKSRETFRNIY
jgi:hypothetical protein